MTNEDSAITTDAAIEFGFSHETVVASTYLPASSALAELLVGAAEASLTGSLDGETALQVAAILVNAAGDDKGDLRYESLVQRLVNLSKELGA